MREVFLPIGIPLITAIILLFMERWSLKKYVSLLSTILTFAVSLRLFFMVRDEGIKVCFQGGWMPPFGITLVADLFSSLMVSLSMLIALTSLIYSIMSLKEERLFYPLFHFLLAGTSGCFLTGDIFNLFVFFEVTLISSYALVAIWNFKENMEATIKYAVINLISTTFLLISAGLLYAIFGSLNMADIALKSKELSENIASLIGVLFIFTFGIKSATFALWFWMPGTYTVIPPGIASFFGGILTKIGVYGFIRVFTLIFPHKELLNLILILSILTMFIGVLGAVSQKEYRTILTFHISSQVGYMIMGLGIFTPLSIAGSIFYIIHHVIVKSALFLCGGIAEFITGERDIWRMGGVSRVLGGVFLVPALSLAGVPPLSGFFAKFILALAGFKEGGVLSLVAVSFSLLVGLLTLFSMMKIYQNVYNGERGGYWFLVLPIGILCLFCLFFGLYPQGLFDICMRASVELLDSSNYINAVLGAR